MLIVALLMLACIAVFIFILAKDRAYFTTKPYQRDRGRPADVLVVYYSRSGNTEAMAREIARRFQANIVRLKAESYPQTFGGWLRATRDAYFKNPAVIAPEKTDMSGYGLVFLGSPIWLYAPAPPLLTYVEKNDFQGKHVILFNTFNSKFGSEAIQDFRKMVETRKGRFLDHIYIRRGRIYNQKSGTEMIKEIRELLDAKYESWQKEMTNAEK